jgi:TetR/AcrR family transcriptional regulator, tetracycline repressor protein
MRPSTPLIAKRKVCETALMMIDRDGIENLSVRRLAREIGVNAASFYHHFENKEAILAGAAQLALADVRTPASTSEDWQVWFLRNTLTLHRVLRQHPQLIEIVLRRNMFRLGLPEVEKTYALLEEQGLPIGLAATLMESLEAFVVGQVMLERYADGDLGTSNSDYPALSRAYAQRALSPGEAFELGCRKIIEGVAEAASSLVAGQGALVPAAAKAPAANAPVKAASGKTRAAKTPVKKAPGSAAPTRAKAGGREPRPPAAAGRTAKQA